MYNWIEISTGLFLSKVKAVDAATFEVLMSNYDAAGFAAYVIERFLRGPGCPPNKTAHYFVCRVPLKFSKLAPLEENNWESPSCELVPDIFCIPFSRIRQGLQQQQQRQFGDIQS